MDIPNALDIPDSFWEGLGDLVELDEPAKVQQPAQNGWPVSAPRKAGGVAFTAVPSDRFKLCLDALSGEQAGSKLKDLVVTWNTGQSVKGRGFSW